MIALLFDMNELWEEYILRQLKKYTQNHPQLGWTVSGQESKIFYGDYRRIRPDIVLRKTDEQGTHITIIDTKWKRPGSASGMEDLRQLYTYARFWQAEKVVLLYPGEDINTAFVPYRNRAEDRIDHRCKSAFVSVVDTVGNLRRDVGERVVEEVVV